MFLSVFDMFKVGIGPSSSHTMGPMVAAKRFLQSLKNSPFNFSGVRVRIFPQTLMILLRVKKQFNL